MFDDIASRFETVFKKLRGRGRLSEANISEAMRDVKRALLEADVNYKVVKKFTSDVQAKALGREVQESITPGQQFVKIFHDELTALMGRDSSPLKFQINRTNIIVMAGLQGSGKTSACAKLALHFRKEGHRPVMAACDTHRAAAVDQLESLGRSLSVPVYSARDKDALTICREAIAFARREGASILLVDTAGRLHIDSEMMNELKEITSLARPDEILFVADAMTGQDAVNVAGEFHREIKFGGIVLTKMDGDARGGAALSIVSVTGAPIRFIGTGEKPDALELFHPERMASRILGMGDILSLVEKASQEIDAEKSRAIEKKIRKNTLDLQDFLEQLQQIKKLGSISDLMSMIPGAGAQIKDGEIDNSALTRVEAIIQSMTAQEKARPVIIDGSRKLRISRGSGTTVQEVNRVLKQFDQMKTMMKRMNRIAGKRGQAAAMRSLLPV